MGREAMCQARLGALSGKGKALLESDELIFRGDFRAKVPLQDVTAVTVRGSALTLVWPGGKLMLMLGKDEASSWAEAITNPKTVMEKLGVKPGLEVVIIGRFETTFRTEIMDTLGVKPGVRPVPGCDLVFVLLNHPDDLEKFEELVPAIAPDGGIWAVFARGRTDVTEDTVRAAARAAGLVDIKVVRISEKFRALEFVIPRAARKPAKR